MILRLRNRNSGFASILLMICLPLCLFIIFALGFTGYFIQYKTMMRSRCIGETVEIQKSLISGEEKLFKLNPLAIALRLSLRLAVAELIAATASGNGALAGEAMLKINTIKAQQAQLDRAQKLIIKTTEINLALRTRQLGFDLNHLSHEMTSIWSFYLESLTTVSIAEAAQVAVQPDSPDLAPVYELAKDYKQRQKLVYFWQHRFRTKSDAQRILETENQFEMSCGTTAQKEGGSWTVLISEAKF